MDLLKAEIARKKKQIHDSNVLVPNKTYFKRSDLAARHEEEYWRKHKRLKSEDDQGPDSDSSLGEASSSQEAKDLQLPRKEVMKRLRDRGEPVRMFAESDQECVQRLRKLEMEQPEINRGFNNDMKTAMDEVDQQYLKELLKLSGADPDNIKSVDVKVKHASWTIEHILEAAKELGKGDESLDSDIVLNFLKLILTLWGDELNSRQELQKREFRGKLASATHRQTVTYIKPLFRQLKKKELNSDLLACLVDIVRHMLVRHYLQANDAYLEMAIGNAPWPIGVTMVGIHARTGREKISARNVAHVLNDETQRKYIQAVKRLMTQCQKYFSTDPSNMVNYERPTQEN